MKPYISSLLLLFAVILETSTSFAQKKPAEVTRPLPSFSYTQGWLGADDAYSVPLAKNKSVWLFGDTFVGGPQTKLRSKAKTMVRNSVGISVCVPGSRCTLKYFWSKQYSSHPRSFFDTGTDDLWYWPLDGFLSGNTLYISLLAVRNKPNATAKDVFGFEIAGTKLATVANAHDSPAQWKIHIEDLTDARLWAGVSIVHDGAYLIWYTQVRDSETHGYMTAMRVPVDKVATLANAWEYLRKDGRWVPGLAGDDAMHVIDQPISEMSVRYHAADQKWIALSTGPEFPSPHAVVRTAETPIGPWSEPKTIYQFPEMKTAYPHYDKDTFCYAVKEHIECSDAKIAMTYACNSLVVSKAVANMNIYRPVPVILNLPQ